METITAWWDVLIGATQKPIEMVLAFIPKVLGALVIFLIGWIIAKIIQKTFHKLFTLIRVDKISETSGIDSFLKTSGIKKPLSWIFARILFWIVILITLLPVSDVLGFSFFADLINQAIGIFPSILIALIILLVGSWGAKVLSGMVRGSAVRLGTEYSELLGTVVNVVVLVITFIIALSQLNIDSTILSSIVLLIVGSISLGFCIAFAFGTKDIIKNAVAGIYINNSFSVGSEIRIRDTEGTLKEIGTLSSVIETGDSKTIKMPNSAFIES